MVNYFYHPVQHYMTRKSSALLLFVLFLLHSSVFAGHVSVERAQTVGQHFLSQQYSLEKKDKNSLNLQLVYPDGVTENSRKSHQSETAYFYVFNASEAGFVIVAGDDRVNPVLGYSTTGAFDPNRIPDNCRAWLENYQSQIRYAVENNISPSAEIEQQWSDYFSGAAVKTRKSTQSVAPLLGNIQWGQGDPFNLQCPYDSTAQQYTYAGCVATAMAQIMRYWKYPEQGTGSFSYNHGQYGTLSADFGATTYPWSSMPEQTSSSMTEAEKNAVATLTYHCGASIGMDYSTTVSGAYMIILADSVLSSEYAFKTYFGYKSGLINGTVRGYYNDAAWLTMLKNDLDADRPVLYGGTNQNATGGHSFVCDGYDDNNYFHFNWGWNGMYDGYFKIDSLYPSGVGIGGDADGYSYNQQAVFGIEPANRVTPVLYTLQLSSPLTINPDSIFHNAAFTISVNIINAGTGSFTGELAACFFDQNNTLLGRYTGVVTLNPGSSIPIVINIDGIPALVEGVYDVVFYYRDNGSNDYIRVNDGNYTNLAQLTVYSPQASIDEYATTERSIKIYPNPVQDVVFIDASDCRGDVLSVGLLGIDGKRYFEDRFRRGEKTRELSLSELASGIYFISVTTRQGVIYKRIVLP